MSLNPLDRGHATQASQTQAPSASAQRTPAPQGMGSVRETVSASADTCPCGFFQPVIDFFSSIFQGIADFFKPIFDFFSGKTETGTGSGVQHTGGIALVLGNDVPPGVYQGLTVNPTKIGEAPQPLDMDLVRHVADHSQPPVQLRELLTKFDEICNALGVDQNGVLYNDQGTDITRQRARQSLENQYIGFVEQNLNRARTGNSDYHPLAAADIDVFLKGIIFELRKPEIDLATKRLALENLCSAAEHCPPRRHTEAMKVYRVISNQAETLEEIIKQYIQATKEDLFVNYYSLARESVMTLNYIRRTVGNQLGLDVNPVNLQDIYISMHDARSPRNPSNRHTQPQEFIGVFNEIYTPANILFHMKNFLNGRIAMDNEWGVQTLGLFINQELQALVANGTITAEEADYEHYIHMGDTTADNDPTTLTDAGVKFLMVYFGILNCATPNGHLVRAATATP